MDLKVGDKFFIKLAYPAAAPPYPNIPPGVLLSGFSSLEEGDFEFIRFEDEDAGFIVFFTLEYYLLAGVADTVLAANKRLIKLPAPTLDGGVSIAICGG